MEEWKIYKLGEITSKIGSGATPKGGRDSYLGGNISLIRSQNVLDFSFSKSGLAYINEMQAEKLNNVEVYEKDVLLNITGDSVARVCIVPNNVLPARVNQHVAIIRGNEKVDYRYLLYYLQYIKPQLLSLSQGGATRNALTKKMIEELEIKMPSKGTQKEIVSILYTLDTKIALNRRINDNLEQQAQLLFDNLIDASDWSTTQFLSELSEINPPRKLSKGEYAPFVEMSNMPTSGSFPSRIDYKEYNGGMKFRNGDTIMARITPCLENGKAAYVNFLKENEIGFGSTEYIVLAPKKTISSSFLYFLVRNKEFVDYAVKHMNGSSGRQRVSGDTIGNYQLPILDRNKLSIFIAIADRTLSKIRQNSFEILNLAKQRDTLLPKLMSGELKINDLNC